VRERAVRNRDNVDQSPDHGVNDREGESPEHEVADVTVHRDTELGTLHQQLKHPLDFFAELSAEPRDLGLVPSGVLYEFELGVRMKL
jgi:hypothetical protein